MFEIDELKKNWQNQKPDKELNINTNEMITGILPKLKKFEKRLFRINLMKTIGITSIMIYMVLVFNFFTTFSLFTFLGIGVILISTFIFLIIYWRSQFGIEKLKVNESSLSFLNNALDNLDKQKKLFKEKFWIFGVCLIAGLNILYLDVLSGATLIERLAMHISMSLIITVTFYFGLKFRMFRFKKEYEPIINELEKIKKDLGGNDVN